MWDLDQTLDQPMDEEAGRLRNMYREKVWCLLPLFLFMLILFYCRENGIFITLSNFLNLYCNQCLELWFTNPSLES
jgi:hypothetical protein